MPLRLMNPLVLQAKWSPYIKLKPHKFLSTISYTFLFFVYTENGIARTAGIILKIDINFLASLW